MDNCHRAVINPGYVETAFGRRRYFFPSDNKAKMKAQERESGNAPELVGGFKWGELMEPVDILACASGNHERSVRSNMHERAETRGRVRRDSNTSTSALTYDNDRRYDIVRTVTNVVHLVTESLDKEPVSITAFDSRYSRRRFKHSAPESCYLSPRTWHEVQDHTASSRCHIH